jgi:hypothetical protein
MSTKEFQMSSFEVVSLATEQLSGLDALKEPGM